MAAQYDYALFSVDGGKYHRPGEPIEHGTAWRPTLTACGRTVTPLNYFLTAADANRHTGGRLWLRICKHCGLPDEAP